MRTNAIACAVTGPLAAWHFGSLPLLAVVFNAVLIPLTSLLVMPLLLVTSLVTTAWPAAAPIAMFPVQLAMSLLSKTLAVFCHIPSLVPVIGIPTMLCTLALSASMILMLTRMRLSAAIFGACAIALLAAPQFSSRQTPPEGALTFDFLDVGQGDSTLITFPDGRHWLVDAGGTARHPIGEKHLLPILLRLGVQRLDTVVLTHFDPDHIAGMPDIARRIPVGRYFTLPFDDPENRESTEAFEELRAAIADQGTTVMTPDQICGTHEIGDVSVAVLHPCIEKKQQRGLSANNASIVLRIRYRGASVLLNGDLSREGEHLLLDQEADLRAQILKVGHHGSRSSSTPEFLRAVKPVIAVASLAPFNRWGFPHAEVIDNLKAQSTQLLRTDRDGAVRVSVTKGHIQIQSQKGSGAPAYLLPIHRISASNRKSAPAGSSAAGLSHEADNPESKRSSP